MTAHLQWDRRDQPFLLAAAPAIDESGQFFDAGQFAEAAGLSQDDARLAGRALIDRGYLKGQYRRAGGGILYLVTLDGVTEKGARAGGLWPPEDGVRAVEDALAQVLSRTTDPEKAFRIRRFLEAFVGLGRDVGVEVSAAIITRSVGLG